MALPHFLIQDRVIPASALPVAPAATPAWSLAGLAGRLIEISGDVRAAPLTAAFNLVFDAQLAANDAAWITLEDNSFFPPDVAESGIDLGSLPVVRVSNPRMAGRAADHLVRSGGFELVVIDLASKIPLESQARSKGILPVPLLTRLLGLARQQNVAVVFLTKKSHAAPSLHSLISLRVEAQWQKRGEPYELTIRPIKDKRGKETWLFRETYHAPPGLR